MSDMYIIFRTHTHTHKKPRITLSRKFPLVLASIRLTVPICAHKILQDYPQYSTQSLSCDCFFLSATGLDSRC